MGGCEKVGERGLGEERIKEKSERKRGTLFEPSLDKLQLEKREQVPRKSVP